MKKAGFNINEWRDNHYKKMISESSISPTQISEKLNIDVDMYEPDEEADLKSAPWKVEIRAKQVAELQNMTNDFSETKNILEERAGWSPLNFPSAAEKEINVLLNKYGLEDGTYNSDEEFTDEASLDFEGLYHFITYWKSTKDGKVFISVNPNGDVKVSKNIKNLNLEKVYKSRSK